MSALITVLALPPAPVSAHRPTDQQQLNPTHFNGDDRCGQHPGCTFGASGETNEAQVASDRFDGVDSLYTMRALATPEALYYEWYHCPSDTNNVFDPGGGCTLIARDTTPTLSQPAPGIAPVAAFEATYDIPSNIQTGKTFRALACIDGPPIAQAHCFGDRTGVHFDDASSTADHTAITDSGQITQPAHAGAVSNGGFTAVAFTSQSDIGRILFCLDIGTSATQSETASPGQGCDPGSAADPTPDDAPCGPVPAGADCWAVSIDPPDNNEFSLGIVEQDDPTAPVSSGTGDCESDTHVGGDGANTGDDCQLDKIYLTSKDLPAPPAPPPPAPTPPPAPVRCPGFQSDARTQFVGTAGKDVLEGTRGPDIICGLGGNDTIRGLGGKDILIGGRGADTLIGGRRGDILRGGPGSDTLRGGRAADTLRGGPGGDMLDGGRGRDRCSGGRGTDVVRRCER